MKGPWVQKPRTMPGSPEAASAATHWPPTREPEVVLTSQSRTKPQSKSPCGSSSAAPAPPPPPPPSPPPPSATSEVEELQPASQRKPAARRTERIEPEGIQALEARGVPRYQGRIHAGNEPLPCATFCQRGATRSR